MSGRESHFFGEILSPQKSICEKYFQEKNIFPFQTSNCYSSVKKENIELCFFANILFLIIKLGLIRGHWGHFSYFYIPVFFHGALRGATPPTQKKIKIKQKFPLTLIWKVINFKNIFNISKIKYINCFCLRVCWKGPPYA